MDFPTFKQQAINAGKTGVIFLKQLARRCHQDRISITAGHLSYVSLLSLVPFIMVFFTILSAFPAFASVKEKLEGFVYNNFVPHAGDVLQQYLTEFVGNASQMGAIGIVFLVLVALLLISNVDKSLNAIWGTNSNRRPIFTFAMYWMVLTLGPLLIGASVLLSSYLVSLTVFADEYTPGLGTLFLKFVPFLISLSAFFILYMLVPNKRIKVTHAASGALVGALLFELSKKGFALYVSSFPSYQVIYGALAVVPILFVWVYLSWMVVLIGAEVTVQVEHQNKEKGATAYSE